MAENPDGHLDRRVEITLLDSADTPNTITTVSVQPLVGVRDVALIRITGADLPHVVLSTQVPNVNTPAAAIVWDPDEQVPHLVPATLTNTDVNTKGDVASLQMPSVISGYSGSPVFDTAGRVFGIITNRQIDTRASVAKVLRGSLPKTVRVDTVDPAQKEVLQRFVTSLCNRGVLHNPYDWEVPSAVYKSLSEVRDEITAILKHLPVDSAAIVSLTRMQKASRDVLQDPTLFPGGSSGAAHPVTDAMSCAIAKFRRTFLQQVLAIKRSYGLATPCAFALPTVASCQGNSSSPAPLPTISAGRLWPNARIDHDQEVRNQPATFQDEQLGPYPLPVRQGPNHSNPGGSNAGAYATYDAAFSAPTPTRTSAMGTMTLNARIGGICGNGNAGGGGQLDPRWESTVLLPGLRTELWTLNVSTDISLTDPENTANCHVSLGADLRDVAKAGVTPVTFQSLASGEYLFMFYCNGRIIQGCRGHYNGAGDVWKDMHFIVAIAADRSNKVVKAGRNTNAKAK